MSEHRRIVGDIAARQDLLVHRRQLIAAGLSRDQIAWLLHDHSLVRVLRGVYLFGAPRLTHPQLLRAATLLAGPKSQLTHRSAIDGYRLLPPDHGRVTVSRPGEHRLVTRRTLIRMTDGRFGLVTIRSSETLGPPTVVEGLNHAALERSLIDFAAVSAEYLVKRAWREAEFRKVLEVDRVRAELDSGRRKGTRRIEQILASHRTVITDETDIRSRGEMTFLKLVADAGLPTPQVNVPMRIGGRRYVADFFYPELGLVVETDGNQHLTPTAGGDDRERDLEFFVDELDVIRMLTDWFDEKPAWCMRTLAAAIERQKRRVPQAR